MAMRVTIGLGLFLAAAAVARAQPARLNGEVRRTAERLDEAAELERAGRHDAALDRYLKIHDDSPDDWVSAADGRLVLPARRVVHQRIAAHSELRERYRRRFEERAERALDEAAARRDVRELTRVVDEWRATRASGRALDVLGDLAFERGEFAAARHAWRSIAESDPLLDRAGGRAKILLAGIFLGESAVAELDEFRREFPGATGRLAGRDGALADTLEQTMRGRPPRLDPPATAMTLGVDAARRGLAGGRVGADAPRTMIGPTPWPWAVTSPSKPGQQPVVTARNLVHHPLVWRGHVVVSDGRRVAAFDLANGRVADVFNDAKAGADDDAVRGSYTLSADGDRLIARLGNGIVCLTQGLGRGFQWKTSWALSAGSLPPGDGTASFDGCPVAHNGRLYGSWSRATSSRATVWMGCWDARRPGDGPVWHREIADKPLVADGTRPRDALVSVAGPNVICVTDAGLVVALGAENGRPAWAVRYQSRGPRGVTAELMPPPRDLCPAVAADGRVFLAPADCGELLAFDVWTGAALWPRPPELEAVHLLGVVDNRLIVTAEGQLRGIGSVDVITGRIDATWGSLTSVPPLGRGLVLADRVLFPTRDEGLKVLRLDGRPVYPPAALARLPGGNLAFGDGRLVVAAGDGLYVLPFAPVTAAIEPSIPKPLTQPTAPSREIAFPPTPTVVLPPLKKLSPCWQFDLRDGERPLCATGDRLVTARGSEVHVRPLQVPAAPVVTTLPFAADEAVAGRRLVVAAGPAGLAGVHVATGKVAWRLSANDLAPRSEGRPPSEGWSQLQVAGSRGFSRLGGDRLVAYDLTTGHVAWDRSRPLDGYDPSLAAMACGVFAKSGPGAELLDAATGRVRCTVPASLEPPAAMADGRVLVTDGPQRVSAIEIESGEVLWTAERLQKEDPGMSPPRPVVSADTPLVVRTDTLRTTLARLDAETGYAEGERPISFPAGPVHPQSIVMTDELVVAVTGRTARCADRKRGRQRWKLELPHATAWRTIPAGPSRVVFAMTESAWAWAETPTATHRWSARLVELKSGKLVDSLDLPTRGPRVVFGGDADRCVIALDGVVLGFETKLSEAR